MAVVMWVQGDQEHHAEGCMQAFQLRAQSMLKPVRNITVSGYDGFKKKRKHLNQLKTEEETHLFMINIQPNLDFYN